MIIIVDYGLGNIRSVKTWLKRGGLEVVITNDHEMIEKADVLILPGVGAFRDAIKRLKELALDKAVIDHANKGKPLIGICLGMQLLFDKSYEDGEYDGLGLLQGSIVPFESSNIKIPHMGWNTLKGDDKYFCDISDEYVYYVHSYYAKTKEKMYYTYYDVKVPGIVQKSNVLGFQFHPEKSGVTGEKILLGIKEFINDYLSSN